MKIRNNWIQNTLNVWDNVRKQGGRPSSISRAMSIASNTDFRPSWYDGGFKRWVDLALVTINELMEGDHLKSFAQLQQCFGLPLKDLFRYFQIRHVI